MIQISKLSSIDIEVTRRCNLSCPYCYMGDHCHERSDMSRDVGDMCIALASKHAKDGKKTTINLFGGEPMLRIDFIRWMTLRIEEIGASARVHVVTNGTIGSDEDADFCKQHGVTFQRSVAGCHAATEAHRPGSYEAYKHRTPRFDSMGSRRVTVTPDTACHMSESVRFLASEGFAKGGAFIPDYESRWDRASIESFKRQLWIVAEDMLADARAGSKPWMFWWFDKWIKRNPGSRDAHVGCGAALSLIGVSYDGNIVPCCRFMTVAPDSHYCAGHISDVLATGALNWGPSWLRHAERCRSGWKPPACSQCSAKAICTANCAASNLDSTGDPDIPTSTYCEFMQEAQRVCAWMLSSMGKPLVDWYTGAKKQENRS